MVGCFSYIGFIFCKSWYLVKESVISPIKDLFVVLVAFNPVDLKMKDKYSRDR